jgi:hypothetical protein
LDRGDRLARVGVALRADAEEQLVAVRVRERPRTVGVCDVGLAAAILIDATIVRMVLVPALMRLLGERAWWTPRRWAERPTAVDGAAA